MDVHNATLPAFATEIWLEIIHILLQDHAVSDPDPVSSSHQPHIALQIWYNSKRLISLGKQQVTLRSVCKRWKDIVDTTLYQYLRPSNLIDNPVDSDAFQRAHRLQLGYPDSVCSCQDGCCCDGYAYWCFGGSRDPKSTRLLADSMSSIDRLQAKILILPRSEWNALMEKPLESVKELLGEIRSLVIEASDSIPKEIDTVCPNLTLLALHATKGLRIDISTEPATFPNLSTLQIVARGNECLQRIGRWNMPSLKYLELTIHEYFGEISLVNFLEKVGKGLVSFQIGDNTQYITLFPGIWNALPDVRYFGTSMFSGDMPPKPPPDHPLRTISNRESPRYNSWRHELIALVDTWTRIECISDTHSWEDMEQQILELERSEARIPGHYCDNDHSVCHDCIDDAIILCERRNVRYEDGFGRTWAEYKQVARNEEV
ncbi:hypothetical protein FRC14_005486 [Serendipita sp. 396]|nr:hypothetical protein FRC14_005486 [Serendipita sp. 396]KAG8776090.1 hypothetical protein FRC15_012128 [Serendipita sp. 397]